MIAVGQFHDDSEYIGTKFGKHFNYLKLITLHGGKCTTLQAGFFFKENYKKLN